MRSIIYICIAVLVVCSPLGAGTDTKNISAARATGRIAIDGILSDGEWGAAVPVSDFLQFDPMEGAEPTERTSVRVLYDNNALYVGIMCYDSDPAGIVHQLTRRDRSVQADKVTIMIDSYHDRTTAFLFSGTVSDIQTDGMLSEDGRIYDVQWDAVWDFDAEILPDGWSAEFKIPLTAIRFTLTGDEYTWGFNVRRYIARKKETIEWVMVRRQDVPPETISSVSRMGLLTGITAITPPLHLEARPYQVSTMEFLSQPFPFEHRKDFSGSAGLDLKYGVSSNVTVDLALNPDFGQVEVDQAVLNLTVFETFYPEKRPFFLEGAPIFSFGTMFDRQQLRLLYSRRIGRRPSGYSTLTIGPNQTFDENPQLTTILGAAKVSGRTGGGLEIGALTAVTDREEAILRDLSGATSPRLLVEPRASYNAVRFRQNVSERSWIGGMATGSFRENSHPSLSGGVDWNVRFAGGAYAFDGYLAASHTTPEAEVRETGAAGRFGLGKLEDEHWIALTTYDFSMKKFEIDDIGFFNQPREHGGYTQISYKDDQVDGSVRRYALTLQSTYRWNWERIRTVGSFELEPSIEFENFWLLRLNYNRALAAHDDRNRGMTGIYQRPERNTIGASLQSDIRRPVVLILTGGFASSTKGERSILTGVQVTIRPTTWMELAPGFAFDRATGEEAWVIPVITPGGRNLFGDRDLEQYDFSLRGTFTFTNRLSVQFFTQVFLAKGRYNGFRELIGGREFREFDYTASPGYANPDFNTQVLNANFVLRWEYLPGSALYLVWTQARSGYHTRYDENLSTNIGNTFKLPMDNVLLAKINYWWSL